MEVWKEVMPQSRFPPVFCCQNIDEHFSTFESEARKISHNKVNGIFGCICCQNIDKHLLCHKHLLFFSTSIQLLTDAFSTQKILFQYILEISTHSLIVEVAQTRERKNARKSFLPMHGTRLLGKL